MVSDPCVAGSVLHSQLETRLVKPVEFQAGRSGDSHSIVSRLGCRHSRKRKEIWLLKYVSHVYASCRGVGECSPQATLFIVIGLRYLVSEAKEKIGLSADIRESRICDSPYSAV